MPKAPLVTLPQFKKTLYEMMAKPKETRTKMSSRNRLNTPPAARATSPANSTLTGSAAEEGPAVCGDGLGAQLLVGLVRAEDGHRVGADAEEAYVPHRQQAGEPDDQVQTHNQYRPDGEDGAHGCGEPDALP